MEAIYEFEVVDMPVTVAVDSNGTSVHITGPEEWKEKIAHSMAVAACRFWASKLRENRSYRQLFLHLAYREVALDWATFLFSCASHLHGASGEVRACRVEFGRKARRRTKCPAN